MKVLEIQPLVSGTEKYIKKKLALYEKPAAVMQSQLETSLQGHLDTVRAFTEGTPVLNRFLRVMNSESETVLIFAGLDSTTL